MIVHLIYQEANGVYMHMTLNYEAGLVVVIDEKGYIVMKRTGVTKKEMKEMQDEFMEINNKGVEQVGY